MRRGQERWQTLAAKQALVVTRRWVITAAAVATFAVMVIVGLATTIINAVITGGSR